MGKHPRSIDLPDLLCQLCRDDVKKQVYAEGARGLSFQELFILEELKRKEQNQLTQTKAA